MPNLRRYPALRALVRGSIRASATGWGTITDVATREPMVALTFDDGPDPEWTPRVLDVLERHGARGTFFMVGRAAANHPEIVDRAAAGGHALGNHSWDHPSIPLLRRRGRRLQMRWCRDALGDHDSGLWRPPWGHQSPASHLDACLLGYRVVTWSVMAEDWLDDDAETLAARVREGLRPGAVALFHDALYKTHDLRYRDRGATVEALEILLGEFSDRYRFVTLPELLAAGRPRRWPWYKRPDLDWLRRQL